MKKTLYITLTFLTSSILIGCGGGDGGGGNGGGNNDSNDTPVQQPVVLPEIVETDLTEGDELKKSSLLSPSTDYDFKTYKTISKTFENKSNMSSGCSIMIYNKFNESESNYIVKEDSLILESYRDDCTLSGLNLTVSTSVNELLIIYSNGGDTKYEKLAI